MIPKLSPDTQGHMADALEAGNEIGQYRVIRLLGRGGMGEVYEVQHRVLRKK